MPRRPSLTADEWHPTRDPAPRPAGTPGLGTVRAANLVNWLQRLETGHADTASGTVPADAVGIPDAVPRRPVYTGPVDVAMIARAEPVFTAWPVDHRLAVLCETPTGCAHAGQTNGDGRPAPEWLRHPIVHLALDDPTGLQGPPGPARDLAASLALAAIEARPYARARPEVDWCAIGAADAVRWRILETLPPDEWIVRLSTVLRVVLEDVGVIAHRLEATVDALGRPELAAAR